MLYLIAHKVRNAPAFDIAEQLRCPICDGAACDECDGEGLWWIIPTSGHRAYPYASWRLEDLIDASDYPHIAPWTFDDRMPSGLPDHYPTSRSSTPSLLSQLKLPYTPKVTRR